MPANACGFTVQTSPKDRQGPSRRHRTRTAKLFLLFPLVCMAMMVAMMRGMRGMVSSTPGPVDHTHDDGLTHAHTYRPPVRQAPAEPCQHVTRSILEVTMNSPRRSLLISSVLLIPMALVVGAGPAAAAPSPQGQ